MAYVTKVSDIAPQYTAYPDIKIDSISYEGGSITVNASQFNASAPVGFAPAVIAQAVVSRKDYYASETNWKVTVPEPPAPKYNFPLAKERLDQIGWDLKAAFNYASSVPYYGRQQDPTFPQDDQTSMEWYAEYGFNNGKGNCYVMAAMFCEMAKLLGYDAHQISGRVPLKAGGYGPHSWVEINFDGTTYVCDPDFTEETKRNGYMITYGQSGTWKYVKDSVMS